MERERNIAKANKAPKTATRATPLRILALSIALEVCPRNSARSARATVTALSNPSHKAANSRRTAPRERFPSETSIRLSG